MIEAYLFSAVLKIKPAGIVFTISIFGISFGVFTRSGKIKKAPNIPSGVHIDIIALAVTRWFSGNQTAATLVTANMKNGWEIADST